MASIIPISRQFDQPTLQHLMAADAVVQRYRTLFALFKVPEVVPNRHADALHHARCELRACRRHARKGEQQFCRVSQQETAHG